MMQILGRLYDCISKLTRPRQQTSIRHIMTANAIDRRRNVRIKYPNIGAIGNLPEVLLEGSVVEVSDISLGGACIIDSSNLYDWTVGQELELDISWPDYRSTQKCMVVGVNLHNRHVQFLDIDPETFVRLNLLLKAGYLGPKFHKVGTNQSTVLVEADEIWLGPTGEHLVFFSELDRQQAICEMRMSRSTVTLFENSLPVYKKTERGHLKGQRVQVDQLNEILVCLANFKNPTENVNQLILKLQSQLLLASVEDENKGS